MKDDIYVSMKNIQMVKNTNVAASSCLFFLLFQTSLIMYTILQTTDYGTL